MAWNNANELVVGGSGQVYTATSGTTLPTDVTVLSSATWTGLGYHSEDGTTLAVTPNVQDFNVWQSRQPARRENLAQEIKVTFTAVQWDEDTVPLAFGGGSISGSNPYTYSFPTDTAALDERALVLDVVDGSNTIRFAFSRGNVTDATEAQFNRSSLAGLTIGYSALAPSGGGSPGKFITNSTGFAAGS